MRYIVAKAIVNAPEQQAMTTPNPMPYTEQQRRGEAIYAAQIRHRLAPADSGKFVLIDVFSGDYEIDDRAARAIIRLRERRPDAVMHEMRNHRTYVGQLRSPGRIVRNTPAAQ